MRLDTAGTRGDGAMSDVTVLSPPAAAYGGADGQAVLGDALLGGVQDGSFALRHMLLDERAQSRRLRRPARALKRTFDVVVAVLMLAVFAPLLVLVSLLIRAEDGGPALFRQTRVGRDGRLFQIVKFRTMCVGAEELKSQLRHHNEAGSLFKLADDPRITRVGRYVRRTCIDELPQLLNVLAGSMSLVGPRPLIPEEDRLVVGWQRARLNAAPGMTGPWQVLAARVPLDEMVAIDCRYVATWSLWSDVKTLAMTLPCVLAMRGM